MSTPLTDSINALTQYANETTGKQDTTLSDAVGSLVEGYGGGGLPTGMMIKRVTKPSQTNWSVNHDLGVKPDVIVLIPVNAPSGTGATNPYTIVGLPTKNTYGLEGHGMMKLYINSSNKTDYTQNIGAWNADATTINFIGASIQAITVQDYYLIAYKFIE